MPAVTRALTPGAFVRVSDTHLWHPGLYGTVRSVNPNGVVFIHPLVADGTLKAIAPHHVEVVLTAEEAAAPVDQARVDAHLFGGGTT